MIRTDMWIKALGNIINLKRIRAVLCASFAVLVFFITGCSSSAEVKPPVYSPDQMALIKQYTADLDALQPRLDEIPPLIASEDWTNIRNLIHGPLGELRFKMLNIARNLPPDLQGTAKDVANDVFEAIVDIDAAAEAQNSARVVSSYNALIKDYERFLDLMPSELPT